MENQQLQFQEEPEQNLDKLLDKLSKRKETERAEAEKKLEAMGPQAVDGLLAAIQNEAKKRRRRRRIGFGVLIAYVCFLVIGLVATVAGKIAGHPVHFPWEVFNFASYTGAFAALFAVSNKQKAATKQLAQYDDVRSVGPLADALTFDDKGVRAIAEEKLVALLPTMQASDGPLLNDEQRKNLHRALRGKNVALAGAILKAYEQVGIEMDIPAVERMAHGEGLAAQRPELKEAAESCLTFIQERVERDRAAQMLLRAAESPGAPADVLLRPASGTSEIDTSTLLRPAVPGGES